MTWWSEWREVYFTLMTLACPLNQWEEPSGCKRIYSDGNRSFYEKDIAGNFDEVEEALWALRNGL